MDPLPRAFTFPSALAFALGTPRLEAAMQATGSATPMADPAQLRAVLGHVEAHAADPPSPPRPLQRTVGLPPLGHRDDLVADWLPRFMTSVGPRVGVAGTPYRDWTPVQLDEVLRGLRRPADP